MGESPEIEVETEVKLGLFNVAMSDSLFGRMSVVGDDVTVMATCVAACVVRTPGGESRRTCMDHPRVSQPAVCLSVGSVTYAGD